MGEIRFQELQKLLPDPLPQITDELREKGLEHQQNHLQDSWWTF